MYENGEGDALRVVSYHAWRACPCDACERERERRNVRVPTRKNPILRLSSEAAMLFGFIARRSPHGSVARALRVDKNKPK